MSLTACMASRSCIAVRQGASEKNYPALFGPEVMVILCARGVVRTLSLWLVVNLLC